MDFRISIDDGHPDDLRIFSMLKELNLLDISTFYIAPYNHERPVMSPADIKRISKEVEIGAHTLTHRVLTKITPNEQTMEIIEGKKILEDITDKKMTRFAYPRGWYNDETKKIVESTGLKEARTMKQGTTTTQSMTDRFAIPITIHAHPAHIDNWKIAFDLAMKEEEKNGTGYFHITMHGWEIEKFKLLEKLNEIFYAIAYSRN